ncbi:hypothetical protein B0H19DRAFT_1253743 [Mycena capillaripes]|nr:hypothetical protein B0H19DRAFT_1253743 [Mycena capillaripes]
MRPTTPFRPAPAVPTHRLRARTSSRPHSTTDAHVSPLHSPPVSTSPGPRQIAGGRGRLVDTSPSPHHPEISISWEFESLHEQHVEEKRRKPVTALAGTRSGKETEMVSDARSPACIRLPVTHHGWDASSSNVNTAAVDLTGLPPSVMAVAHE